jgi:hypothetical protein
MPSWARNLMRGSQMETEGLANGDRLANGDGRNIDNCRRPPARSRLAARRPPRHQWSRSSMCKRSRAEGDKGAEVGQNPTRAMPRRREPDGGDCGTESGVSGSAVSVPRGRSPTRSGEARHPFQPPSRPGTRREVYGRPNEATFDASPQMDSVSSDRSRGYNARTSPLDHPGTVVPIAARAGPARRGSKSWLRFLGGAGLCVAGRGEN